MKASELRDIISDLIDRHGDLDVMIDPCGRIAGLYTVEECDIDSEDNGFVLWAGEEVAMLSPGEMDARD